MRVRVPERGEERDAWFGFGFGFGFGLDGWASGERRDAGIPCPPPVTVHGPAPLTMSCTRHMSFSRASAVRGSAEVLVELWLARRFSTVSPQSLHYQLCLVVFVHEYGIRACEIQ